MCARSRTWSWLWLITFSYCVVGCPGVNLQLACCYSSGAKTTSINQADKDPNVAAHKEVAIRLPVWPNLPSQGEPARSVASCCARADIEETIPTPVLKISQVKEQVSRTTLFAQVCQERMGMDDD